MLKRPAPEQTALEIVTLDQLVPANHLAQDRPRDRLWFYPRSDCALSCPDNGRSPLDPTLIFKALLIGTCSWFARV